MRTLILVSILRVSRRDQYIRASMWDILERRPLILGGAGLIVSKSDDIIDRPY